MSVHEKVKKILLVDDDIDLLEQHTILLKSKGYEIITAENVEDGWNEFKKEKPDAAILDLIMEEHDSGFILCHRIKRDPYGKNIPVFLLTSATYLTGYKFGSSTSEEKEWIKCDAVLNKPIVFEELLKKLEHFFETVA
ncbi:MAG: response regulator [Bacteroidota bacterium]|jgi:DNA-binding response OmpR family regulator|nr:response regulator [Ignavibacteria bacterium]MCU7497671.1 response regulator [Ignavibacteria bacterium]MCU7511024.1 response regulator [Ignavibacteria bacterium]MCU7518878.1 response regulator [Ignavibacteria bacterium]MCU7523154.1 response regulator [Ignavibacteria bacterium]